MKHESEGGPYIGSKQNVVFVPVDFSVVVLEAVGSVGKLERFVWKLFHTFHSLFSVQPNFLENMKR
jgi:hypothetical protein